MALIAVLWIVGLLGLLAAAIGSAGRTHADLSFEAVEMAKARAAADAGAYRALFGLLSGDAERSWPPGGALAYHEQLGEAHVDVLVGDEDGKIDLNAASPALLAGLLQHTGLDKPAADRWARSIDRQRRDGAGGRPSHQHFRHPDDLRQIADMPEPLLQRLRAHLTVYSGANGIDPLRASEAVLHAGILAASESASIDNVAPGHQGHPLPVDRPDELTALLGEHALPSRNLMFRIHASGVSDGGGRFLREAIVALDGGRYGLPATIHAWRHAR